MRQFELEQARQKAKEARERLALEKNKKEEAEKKRMEEERKLLAEKRRQLEAKRKAEEERKEKIRKEKEQKEKEAKEKEEQQKEKKKEEAERKKRFDKYFPLISTILQLLKDVQKHAEIATKSKRICQKVATLCHDLEEPIAQCANIYKRRENITDEQGTGLNLLHGALLEMNIVSKYATWIR